jgi:pimeloyl-ACP methyl ester carboxylesterase
MGRLAEERNYAAIAHVRTENVATDMLKITEALGYPKLQYFGLSYGTLLGTT